MVLGSTSAEVTTSAPARSRRPTKRRAGADRDLPRLSGHQAPQVFDSHWKPSTMVTRGATSPMALLNRFASSAVKP